MADKSKQTKIPKELLPGYEWETFGGKGKRIKNGKEIKITYQTPLKDLSKRLGLGVALRGGGRAFNKGGRVK